MVIGGDRLRKTEMCALSGEMITCNEHEFALWDYTQFPELMLVDDDFGYDC